MSASNSRASLLANLRTGGVRSTSGSYPPVPHTAAPGGAFNTNPPPRFVSNALHEVDEQDELADQFAQTLHFRPAAAAQRQVPMTAAADQQFFQSQYQQQQVQNAEQLQLLQYQRMQLEIMKYQALQAQQQIQQQQVQQQAQYQNMLARRQGQTYGGRRANYDTAPVTAAPSIQSFAAAAQLRAAQRQQQQELYAEEPQVPMTAAIGGKFAARGLNPNATAFMPPDDSTYVISGGTQLGINTNVPKPSSKSDTAVSWRRSPDSAASQQAPFSSQPPRVKITPPPPEQQQLPPRVRSRPAPLKFTQPADDDSASSSDTAPITPPSAEAALPPPPLSPREEASKRLYEGLGYNRHPQIVNAPQVVPVMPRVVSQPPLRQPLGPPSGADELGPRNFATRLVAIRAQTVANMHALLDARRELVEAY